jgi:hypothetical protein
MNVVNTAQAFSPNVKLATETLGKDKHSSLLWCSVTGEEEKKSFISSRQEQDKDSTNFNSKFNRDQ